MFSDRLKKKIEIKFFSLKFRLMAFITIILLLVVGVPVGLFVYQLDKNYSDFSVNMIETTSQVVYQFIFDGMMKNDSLVIQHNLELLAMEPTIKQVRIYRPTGKILYSSSRSEVNKNVRTYSNMLTSSKDGSSEIEAFARNGNIYTHRHPIYIQKECTPCHKNEGALIAVMDIKAGFTQSDQMYVASKKLIIFGGVLIIVILWILLNLLYQSQVETRLKTIMAGFEHLPKGNFDFKIRMPGQHELALLAQKFNQMVENLKISRQKEEQFFLEKLQRADRLVTLGEVAAEIAHEVNNPAGIILTRAEYLKDEMLDQNVNSGSIEDLDIIIQQTEKIAETTRSILHYSRKLPHTFSEVNLNELIPHSIKILEPRIKKCKVKIKLNMPQSPSIVWGNFNQLEQVFCNLINNSLDFICENSGVIQVVTKKIYDEKGKSIYRVAYQDNGPGVPDEYHNKIFSPFFTTKDSDKGTGLGLFIVKNILANHNANINLEKVGHSGARFIITMEVYDG
ncbi:MAG: ATP-binding protein [Calditrichia bacterium]